MRIGVRSRAATPMMPSPSPISEPTPEHYLPLLYIIATQDKNDVVSLPVDGIELGSIGMLTAIVGSPAD